MSFILSVNAGSSSLKISVYTRSSSQDRPVDLRLTSSISNIPAPPATFSFNGKEETVAKDQVTDHASAFAHFLARLGDKDRDNVKYICHRVVHGGNYLDRVVITDESYHHIETLSDLAPLHNGAALSVIKACLKQLPEAISIAYFDTAFHRSIPPHIASYAIDQSIAKEKGLKKYGFHGLSYAFILRAVSQFLNRSPTSLNLIVLHLGAGASACAIREGKSLDTSMGLTPLNGLPGATRSGAIDPSLIFHYTNKAGKITYDPGMAINLHVTEAEDILNRKSGWKALTGTTDFRVVTKHAELSASTKVGAEMDPYTLAFHLFVDRILDFVGGYFLKLDGRVDALVFSGGIGERSKELRSIIGEKVACLGFAAVDRAHNEHLGDDQVVDISSKGHEGTRKIIVCKTDEQVEMARACSLDQEFW